MTDEHEKHLQAIVKYFGDDVVKTIAIMIEMIDKNLIDRYMTWIGNNKAADRRCQKLFRTLWDEINDDWKEHEHVFRDFNPENQVMTGERW